jgi:mRNA interferase RelE/StbE
MIEFHKQAEKFILSQSKTAALRLYRAIEKLPLGDVKRLSGHGAPPLYRLRVGGYRVIFCSGADRITIIRIDTRGDVYKGI